MASKIIWSSSALDDLREIHSFICRDAESYATRMIDRILSAVEPLSDFPQLGRVVPERNDASYREVIIRPYRVVYKNTPGRIDIIAIIHGARDFERAIGDRVKRD
jgi:toxin ParE1/3/4